MTTTQTTPLSVLRQLTVMQLGALTRLQPEPYAWLPALSLLDLAIRGYLTIICVSERFGTIMPPGGQLYFELLLQRAPAALEPDEQGLLAIIFGPDAAIGTRTAFGSTNRGGSLQQRKQLWETINQSLIQKGLATFNAFKRTIHLSLPAGQALIDQVKHITTQDPAALGATNLDQLLPYVFMFDQPQWAAAALQNRTTYPDWLICQIPACYPYRPGQFGALMIDFTRESSRAMHTGW